MLKSFKKIHIYICVMFFPLFSMYIHANCSVWLQATSSWCFKPQFYNNMCTKRWQ